MTGRILLGDHKEETDDGVKWESGEVLLHQWDPFFLDDQLSQPSADGRTYELPFELFIRGDQEESFRGCNRCGMTYRLEASTIHEDSSDTFQDFVPIQIIRCPPLSAYELMDPTTVQGRWSKKVEFNVSVGYQAIALGGLIPVDAQLTKLEPQVKLVKAKFYLRECHTIRDKLATSVVTYQGQRTVTQWPLDLDNAGHQWQWQQCLELPKVVRDCSPDFNVCGISISHTLHFETTLLERDGTESEYETAMPISLFVSPELPVNGWGVFARDNEKTTSESMSVLSEGIRIPPKYCNDHVGTEDYGRPPGTPPPVYSEF
ncbi:hypothetical protein FDECE_4409 [Fusarium decemcellulare]|nr:hypothetical protein FDECE_4409 [Fusarium decemcellulare]